ncbi:hypothetical protein DL98DRAFT_640566 [Cadophora sp. DSE1049]|nr:hypothetical protein DL98DRAFT_640566 [Cadophora sp. DSE1049]
MSDTSFLLPSFTTAPPSPPPTPSPGPSSPPITTTNTKFSPVILFEFSLLLQKHLPPSLATAWDPNLPLGLNISSLLSKDRELGVQGLCVCGCVCRREVTGKERIRVEEIGSKVAEKLSQLLAAKQAKMSEYGNGYEEQENDQDPGTEGLENSRTCWCWATAGEKCCFTASACHDLHAFIPVNRAEQKRWEEGEVEELARLLGLMAMGTGDGVIDIEVDGEEGIGNKIDGWEPVML